MLERMSGIGLSMGVAALIWTYGRGNQQIAALPAAYYLAVLLWPTAVCNGANRGVAGKRGGFCRHWIFLFVFSAFIWTGVCYGIFWPSLQGQPTRAQIVDELDNADALARKGNFRKCLNVLESLQIPKAFPFETARREHNLAMLLLRTGRRKEARRHLMYSVELDPGNVRALYALAVIAATEGRASEAIGFADAALKIAPDFGSAAELKRRLFKKEKRVDR